MTTVKASSSNHDYQPAFLAHGSGNVDPSAFTFFNEPPSSYSNPPPSNLSQFNNNSPEGCRDLKTESPNPSGAPPQSPYSFRPIHYEKQPQTPLVVKTEPGAPSTVPVSTPAESNYCPTYQTEHIPYPYSVDPSQLSNFQQMPNIPISFHNSMVTIKSEPSAPKMNFTPNPNPNVPVFSEFTRDQKPPPQFSAQPMYGGMSRPSSTSYDPNVFGGPAAFNAGPSANQQMSSTQRYMALHTAQADSFQMMSSGRDHNGNRMMPGGNTGTQFQTGSRMQPAAQNQYATPYMGMPPAPNSNFIGYNNRSTGFPVNSMSMYSAGDFSISRRGRPKKYQKAMKIKIEKKPKTPKTPKTPKNGGKNGGQLKEPHDPDARSRKHNMAYPKGTFLLRLSDLDKFPNIGDTLWLVDSYQLIQKFVFDRETTAGQRFYTKTERYSGWLADEPWLYFPLHGVEVVDMMDSDGNRQVLLPSIPTESEMNDHVEREKQKKGEPRDPQPPTEGGNSVSCDLDKDILDDCVTGSGQEDGNTMDGMEAASWRGFGDSEMNGTAAEDSRDGNMTDATEEGSDAEEDGQTAEADGESAAVKME